MASPVAERPGELLPRVARPAYRDELGAGDAFTSEHYAVHVERNDVSPLSKVIVTRLSDGFYWVIPPRPERGWGALMVFDDEELVLTDTKLVNGRTSGFEPGIVRLRLDGLGTPVAPGSGF
ncbi:MAG: hypothetical protein KC731_00060 [Myxococcales bacterium]|nr:hypothetical protein [Myxococcales bacterium]